MHYNVISASAISRNGYTISFLAHVYIYRLLHSDIDYLMLNLRITATVTLLTVTVLQPLCQVVPVDKTC